MPDYNFIIKGILVQAPCQDEEDEPLLVLHKTFIWYKGHIAGFEDCPKCGKTHMERSENA